jgi:hypothetical protein
MANTEADVLKHIKSMTPKNSMAEFIATAFKDKFIEIYLGDAYEEVSTEQVSMAYPSVFCGKVVGAFKECLMINAAYIDTNDKLSTGNIVFINERAIRALTEVANGSIEDLFLRSKDAINIKKYFDMKK